MQTATIKVDEDMARERLRAYRDAKAPKTEQDIAIMRALKHVARGKVIIQAHESIRQAGFFDNHLPKLALAKAHWTHAFCRANSRGGVVQFQPTQWGRHRPIEIAWRDVERPYASGRAIVPMVPLPQRPKAHLSNYHILWEADWSKVPVDPLLLRHLTGDLWLVCAAWDLSELERAVIAE